MNTYINAHIRTTNIIHMYVHTYATTYIVLVTYPCKEVNDCAVKMPSLILFCFLFLITINPIMQIKTVHNPNMPPATEVAKIIVWELVVVLGVAESIVALVVAESIIALNVSFIGVITLIVDVIG